MRTASQRKLAELVPLTKAHQSRHEDSVEEEESDDRGPIGCKRSVRLSVSETPAKLTATLTMTGKRTTIHN